MIAISLLIDMPKALDEGDAAVVYEGAEARLLDGFWVQLVTAGVLIACGALLPRYLRADPRRDTGSGRARLRRWRRQAAKGSPPAPEAPPSAPRPQDGRERKVQGAGT